MNPWLVFWAPQLTFPFGGSVAQRIEPTTQWFFDAIAPTAGDAIIERKAFEVASYGRQLGLITEVLMDLTAQMPPSSTDGRKALTRLKEIQGEIDGLKAKDADELLREVEALVGRLKKKHKDRFPRAKAQIEQALASGDA